MDLTPKEARVDEDASGEGSKSMQSITEEKLPTFMEDGLEEPSSLELKTESTHSAYIDKSTDTAASTNANANANADKQNILQVALAKQEYSEVFNLLELNFFEKLFRM